MNKILAINEINDEQYFGMSGYDVVTTEGTISMRIDNFQSCCEDWGYMMSEDNLEQFKQSDLLKVEVVNRDRVKQTFIDNMLKNDVPIDSLDEGGVMFINFETSKGLLQFVVYNAHNGYYGHDVKITLLDQFINETL